MGSQHFAAAAKSTASSLLAYCEANTLSLQVYAAHYASQKVTVKRFASIYKMLQALQEFLSCS